MVKNDITHPLVIEEVHGMFHGIIIREYHGHGICLISAKSDENEKPELNNASWWVNLYPLCIREEFIGPNEPDGAKRLQELTEVINRDLWDTAKTTEKDEGTHHHFI